MSMKVNRKVARVSRPGEGGADGPSLLPPAELLAFVWDLTMEIYSLQGGFDAESRLQRDAVRLVRGRS